MKKKVVMVFGVFDRLHPGHLDFLRQAQAHGDELIAVVARDTTVMKLKNRRAHYSETERLAMVRAVPHVTHAVLGDGEQGSYGVITEHQPDVICVGYDQHGLAEDLKEKNVSPSTIVQLESHHPKKFHTSYLT